MGKSSLSSPFAYADCDLMKTLELAAVQMDKVNSFDPSKYNQKYPVILIMGLDATMLERDAWTKGQESSRKYSGGGFR